MVQQKQLKIKMMQSKLFQASWNPQGLQLKSWIKLFCKDDRTFFRIWCWIRTDIPSHQTLSKNTIPEKADIRNVLVCSLQRCCCCYYYYCCYCYYLISLTLWTKMRNFTTLASRKIKQQSLTCLKNLLQQV